MRMNARLVLVNALKSVPTNLLPFNRPDTSLCAQCKGYSAERADGDDDERRRLPRGQ